MSETLLPRSSSSDRSPPAGFECSLSHEGLRSAWVRVAGELDLATAAQLELTLRRAQRRAQLIVVDLRGLTFMDSSGLHELINAAARSRRNAGRLVIVNVPPQASRLLEVTHLARLLEIGEDPAALDAGRPATAMPLPG